MDTTFTVIGIVFGVMAATVVKLLMREKTAQDRIKDLMSHMGNLDRKLAEHEYEFRRRAYEHERELAEHKCSPAHPAYGPSALSGPMSEAARRIAEARTIQQFQIAQMTRQVSDNVPTTEQMHETMRELAESMTAFGEAAKKVEEPEPEPEIKEEEPPTYRHLDL